MAEVTRARELQHFLTLLRGAMVAASGNDTAERALIEDIFAALDDVAPGGAPEAVMVPAVRHIEEAVSNAKLSGDRLGDIAVAVRDLAPALPWRRRPGGRGLAPDFAERHGNATIVGNNGLEPRDDISVGVSLLAPGTRYPDHRHPPEEIYLALSEGQWLQGDSPWRTPGPGGLVHNPPDIVHAMQSAPAAPLLAVWCLRHDTVAGKPAGAG